MLKNSQSEVLPLASVLLSPVSGIFENNDNVGEQWKDLNYIGRPDYTRAIEEYHAFELLLRSKGINCLYLPPSSGATLDAIYCRDASVATEHGMIICRMGKTQRVGEPALHQSFYRARGIPVLGTIMKPGTLEGGDVAWLDRSTLAVARSERTNRDGISQLKAMLAPFSIDVFVVDLPNYRGAGDVFHLMSVISPVAEKVAVVYPPLLPNTFTNELRSRGYRFIEVPEEEFLSMGCNVLALSLKTCVMVSGNPVTRQALQDKGFEVLLYEGNEISIKGGGGPTCLTRPLDRHSPTYILR